MKELDALCRTYVMERDKYTCRKCGKQRVSMQGGGGMQWAHVFSRRYRVIRWNPDNSMALCAGCHLWWHHQPVAAADWWVGQVGTDVRDALRSALASPGKADLALIKVHLRTLLAGLATGEAASSVMKNVVRAVKPIASGSGSARESIRADE